ncbi:hypothetical protein [Streptomyces lavendulocolor]|uniref:hypothetical protein n=1 Tax=Streptomyces lavendulocolor TaxID=67316 RepID=UPI0031DC922C
MTVQIPADADPQGAAAVRPTVLAQREELRIRQYLIPGKVFSEVVLDKPDDAPAFHERVLQEHATN